MSADNYNLIRKDKGEFVVTMGFMSDVKEPPIKPTDKRFSTYVEALEHALGEWTEYGVKVSDDLLAEFEAN